MDEKQKLILNAQIEALNNNLERIKKVVTSPMIEPSYRNQIYGKFFTAISEINEKIKDINTGMASGSKSLQECWMLYEDAHSSSNRVFDQCLDFLGGIAVRRMKLEEGICDLAEELVLYYSNQTDVSWRSVMILGEDREFDEISSTTEIIRLHFPEWDVWNLPFTAYQFGLLIAGKYLPSFIEFYKNEGERIQKLLTEKDIPPEELLDLADSLLELRKQVIAGGDYEQALKYKKLHLRSLFADTFATYVLGPAYIYARLFLRFSPASYDRDQSYEPSYSRRIAFMVWAIEKMNEDAKTDEYQPGPYETEIKRIKDWSSVTIQTIEPGFQGDFKTGKPYDDWFQEIYGTIKRKYGLAGFSIDSWDQAQKLGSQLLTKPELTPETTLPAVLNAGWYARINNPTRVSDIAERVHELLYQVVHPSEPPIEGGAPSERPGGARR